MALGAQGSSPVPTATAAAMTGSVTTRCGRQKSGPEKKLETSRGNSCSESEIKHVNINPTQSLADSKLSSDGAPQ